MLFFYHFDNLNFTDFYVPKECVNKNEKFFEDHKHDYLVAHQSGGRLIINNNVLFFSTGDFRYRILAQDKSRDVGKLVSINLDTNEKKIISKAISGPFKSLDSSWFFKNIDQKQCRVDFMIEYQFSIYI